MLGIFRETPLSEAHIRGEEKRGNLVLMNMGRSYTVLG